MSRQHAIAPIVDMLAPLGGVLAANDEWGANCGPVAIAGALGLSLDVVRDAVSTDAGFRGHMGVRDFRSALAKLRAPVVRSWSRPIPPTDVFEFGQALGRVAAETEGAPLIVLARFCGPWDGVPRAAATYRHAFAYRRVIVNSPDWWLQRQRGPGWVLDANATGSRSAVTWWLPAHAWTTQVLVHLIPERGDCRVAVDWISQVGTA